MITVTIHRKTLVRHDACADGLALFDAIAALQPESDPRRLERIKVRHWTPLHSLWAIVAGHASFLRWAENLGIVPRADLAGAYLAGANLAGAYLAGAYLAGADLAGANLAGANLVRADLAGANLAGADLAGANLAGANLVRADLAGAYRGSSPAVPGWRTDASGYLEHES